MSGRMLLEEVCRAVEEKLLEFLLIHVHHEFGLWCQKRWLRRAIVRAAFHPVLGELGTGWKGGVKFWRENQNFAPRGGKRVGVLC